MKAYIASPFFNEIQVKEVESIENEASRLGLNAFSPRLSEASKMYNEAREANLDPESDEMKRIKKYIFIDDLRQIDDIDILFINLNNFDSGTLWELGYYLQNNSYGWDDMVIPFGSNQDKLPDLIRDSLRIQSQYRSLVKGLAEDKSWNIIADFRFGYPKFSTIEVEDRYKYDQDWNRNINSIWVLAEAFGKCDYRGLSKVFLGYLYGLPKYIGPSIRYIDMPRKSNIMLTQSGTHVYEYTGTNYSEEEFDLSSAMPNGLKPLEAGYDD